MMERRAFLGTLAGSLLTAPLAAEAQPAGKLWRIGFLGPASGEPIYADSLLSLRRGLRDLGYVEGENIALESRFAEDKYERLPELAAVLVRENVDLIVAHATPWVRAAKQATRTIPIVMVSVADPVGAGSVASLARPGGNITRLSNTDAGLAAKCLEMLKEQAAARSLGIKTQLVDVRDRKELESTFSVMAKARVDAFERCRELHNSAVERTRTACRSPRR
jgi:ABC-type uncharacterized transport system substrate-binding protein